MPHTRLGGDQICFNLRKTGVESTSVTTLAIPVIEDRHGGRRKETHYFALLGSRKGTGGGADHINAKLHKRTHRCDVSEAHTPRTKWQLKL